MNAINYSCMDVDRLMKRYYLPVAYSLIFIVGLVGNMISIGIYLTKLRPWKSSSIIMVNLALTDLLYVLTMPFLIYYYINEGSWILGDFMCRFMRFAFHFHLYGSILFLTCLAVFRYVVVVQPFRAPQVQDKFWGTVACLTVWTVAAAETTPMLTIVSLSVDGSNNTQCLVFASTEPVTAVREYSWLLTAIGFLLPLLAVFFCNIGIVTELAKGPSLTHSWRNRAQCMMVLILGLFVLCFLPYHIMRGLWIETQHDMRTLNTTATTCSSHVVQAAYLISRPLAAINTFFNLALYTLSGNKFRRAFLSVFCREPWLIKAGLRMQRMIITKATTDIPAIP